MPLSCLAKAARLAVVLSALSGAVKAQSAAEACAGLMALEGAALSWLTLPLPDTPQPPAHVWALIRAGGVPMTLPVDLRAAGEGALLLPLTPAGGPEGMDLALVGLDSWGAVVWACPNLTLRVTPPPPMPGGRDRAAARAEGLADLADCVAGSEGAGLLPPGLGEGLRLLASDLRAIEAAGVDPADLERLDAVLGAFEALMPDRLGLPPPPRPALDPTKFFPATLARTDPTTYRNVCPTTPEQLTEYIDLGVRARINTDAGQQLLLSTGLTLAGLSARLANRALGGAPPVDRAIDTTITSLAPTQAVLSDYLAGMMPLTLERLEVSHDPTEVPDDALPESRAFRIHRVWVHTRSDGWSPTKAAFDIVLAVATVGTGGGAGQATSQASGALRGQADEVLAATRLGLAQGLDIRLAERNLSAARDTAIRSRRIAQAVQAQGLGDKALTTLTRAHAEAAEQAVVVHREALDALGAETRAAAEGARQADTLRAQAEVVDNVIAPGFGVAEGAGQGVLSGGLFSDDNLGPIARQVARCRVDVSRGADGQRPPHLWVRVVEGDSEVLREQLEGLPGVAVVFDTVGPGRRTLEVTLNPRLDLFPLTRHRALPRHVIEVHVGQIQGRIDGLPMAVQAGSTHDLVAWVGEVGHDLITAPRLRWSVDPPMPLAVTDTLTTHAARLTVPEGLPEGTLITVRIEALGDFLSAARVEPAWVAVAQVREADERLETYLLADCRTLLLMTPSAALVLENPHPDFGTVEEWLFWFYQRQ